jgi:hypothetical protein
MHGEHDGGEGDDDGGHPYEAEVHEEVDRVVGEDRLQPVEEAVQARPGHDEPQVARLDVVRVRVRDRVRVRLRLRRRFRV